MHKTLRTLLLTTTTLGLIGAAPAHAASSDTQAAIKALQKQMEAMQEELAKLRAESAAEKAQPAAAQQTQSSPMTASSEGIQKEVLPGVKVTLGGFVDATTIYRSKNQSNDSISNFNTLIPFNNSVNAHQSEFRMSGRSSRLSLLTEGNVDKDMKLSAYFESDFFGAGLTSNNVATNSYAPRLRQAWGMVDRDDWGLHILGGQTYSLVTMTKKGLSPRTEALPIGIDTGLVPGFNYTRNATIRVVKDFADKTMHVGLSAESPQVNFGGVTTPTTLVQTTATGTSSSLNSTAQYSTDIAPDVVAKLAYDSPFGHYEMFGITRFFHANTVSDMGNHYTVGYGGGAGAYVPVLPKYLTVQAQFMGGKGIGRYGVALMPDFAFGADGSIKPLTQYTAMFGVISQPTPTWDLYTYVGGEIVDRENVAGGTPGTYGYGDYALNNAGCLVRGGSCSAQTESIWQVTPGFWKQLYKGDYGTMKVGAQYSYTRRNAFSDANGIAPSADAHMIMTSFRYAPF